MSKTEFDTIHLERYKVSGLSLAAYCRQHGINTWVLQYHLAKERDRDKIAPSDFIRITPKLTADWLTVQFGQSGLRIKLHLDFLF